MASFEMRTSGSKLYASSVDPSISDTKEVFSDQEDIKFIVVGQKLANSPSLKNALKYFGAPVIYSDTGFEHMKDADDETVFVVETFEGSIFQQLYREGCRIVAPPVVLKAALNNESIPYKTRPLYCTSMNKLVLCFSGFKTKDDLTLMADLVHYMGGGIRKDFSAKVTHLVAMRSGGEKYRAAVSLGTHIMSDEWVHRCWELRDEYEMKSTDEHLMQFKLSPFSFSVLSFYGFKKEDLHHLEEVTIANGGLTASPGEPSCTHLVVNEHEVKALDFEISEKLRVVKSEWFWASIQMDACAEESMYLFEISGQTPPSQGCRKTPQTLSGSRSHKRKRLRENIAQLASEGENLMYKRKSLEQACRSLSSSFLDTTNEHTAVLSDITLRDNEIITGTPNNVISKPKETTPLTARQQTILELFQTETNYVAILNTILKVFKEEIERTDQPGGSILELQDSKAIFGGIPPIHDVHTKIRDALNEIVTTWSEKLLVGDIFLRHAEALSKFYPSFVNYFEKTKETIIRCDKSKPRFHAFLKLCQGKPECGRQTLTELLIRPVQRLPSVMLLLKDILKRTEKSHSDHSQLDKAIATLEEVMTHINEDKRKAEGHQAMFEIINNIENCPANLLSAHRSFIRKSDMMEATDCLSGKGDPITLFVFSDCLEICKRRLKAVNAKSPASVHGNKTLQKLYKHLNLLPLSSIKRIVDIPDSSECRNVFALISKKIEDKEEKLFAFAMNDQASSKEDFLLLLSKTICANMCRADYETLLATVDAQALSIDTSDLFGFNSLSRAATKFGKRVSRAFSLNKTPHNNMKRAISSMTQMVSPMKRDGSTLTLPSIQSSGSTPHGSISSRLNSESEWSDADSYLGYSEQMSQGTPVAQKRRETLAGTFVTSDTDTSMTTLKQSVDNISGIEIFATPRPVAHRPSPMDLRYASSRRDFSSTQSLAIRNSTRLGSASPAPRTSSTLSCANKTTEHYV